MYKFKTIITMSFVMVLFGIISINAQTIVKGDRNAGELNSLELDSLTNQLMDTDAKMRVVARLGDGETAILLNKQRLEAARSYLIEMRGIDTAKVVFTEGEAVKGEGRLEFYLGENLMLVSLAERGKNIRIGCCGDDEEVNSPATKKTKTPKNKKNSVETQIIALEKQAWEAWKNKDVAFFQNLLVDDALSVNSGGVFDKPQILEYYGSCNVKSYSLDDFKFRMLDKNSALITFTATQDAVCGGEKNPSTVRATSVYVKRGGKWLNSFYTETAATN